MRFNAHLLQSRGGVANIGAGNEAAYSDGSLTKNAAYYRGTGAKEAVGTILASETRYKRIYADKIYCSKYNGSSYDFASFFDGKNTKVKQHELITAGQMSDYITNSAQGVIPKWLGDHQNAIQTYDLGTVITPISPDWKNYDFNHKMYAIFNRLLKDADDEIANRIPNIYATNVWAERIEGSVTASDATATNLSAGRADSSSSDFIFKVFGGAVGGKHIEIVRGNNSTAPIGIHGTFNDTTPADALADYGAGNFSFVDVGRYYFRDANERGKITTIGKSYMQANASGVIFNFGLLSRSLTLGYPSVNGANVLTSAPTVSPLMYLFNGSTNYDFSFYTKTSTNGIVISRDDIGPSYERYFRMSIKDGGDLLFTDNNTVPIYLKQSSGTIKNASDLHVLRSEAPEIIYGTNTTSYNEILRFAAGANLDRKITLGYKGEITSQSRFYVTQYNSATDIICAVPFLSNNSEFIVSNPTNAQTINKILNLTVSGQTIILDPGNINDPYIRSNSGKSITVYSDNETRLLAPNSSILLSSGKSSRYHQSLIEDTSDGMIRQVIYESIFTREKYKLTSNMPAPSGVGSEVYLTGDKHEWRLTGKVIFNSSEQKRIISDHAYFDNFFKTATNACYINACFNRDTDGGYSNSWKCKVAYRAGNSARYISLSQSDYVDGGLRAAYDGAFITLYFDDSDGLVVWTNDISSGTSNGQGTFYFDITIRGFDG